MEKPSTARIALKWGIICAILIIIFTILLYITDSYKNPFLAWIPFLLLLGGVIMSIKEFKSLNNDFLEFSDGLGLGTLLSAVIGLLVSIFTYVYTTFVDTTIIKRMQEFQIEQLEERGLSSEQIDAAMALTNRIASPGLTFILSVFFYILFGFVFSLIVSAVLKKSKPEMDF